MNEANQELLKRFNQDNRFKEKVVSLGNEEDIIRNFFPPLISEIIVPDELWGSKLYFHVKKTVEEFICDEVSEEFSLIFELMEKNETILETSSNDNMYNIEIELDDCKSLSKDRFLEMIEHELEQFMMENLDFEVLLFDLDNCTSSGCSNPRLYFFRLLEQIETSLNKKIPSEYFSLILYFANKIIKEDFTIGDPDEFEDVYYTDSIYEACTYSYMRAFKETISDYYDKNILPAYLETQNK